jgi:hypothetical protein
MSAGIEDLPLLKWINWMTTPLNVCLELTTPHLMRYWKQLRLF